MKPSKLHVNSKFLDTEDTKINSTQALSAVIPLSNCLKQLLVDEFILTRRIYSVMLNMLLFWETT